MDKLDGSAGLDGPWIIEPVFTLSPTKPNRKRPFDAENSEIRQSTPTPSRRTPSFTLRPQNIKSLQMP
jgi:hypothetical protein